MIENSDNGTDLNGVDGDDNGVGDVMTEMVMMMVLVM